jgi:hypothetical protein
VLAGCIGAVRLRDDHRGCGAVAIGRSDKGRGTCCLTAMSVMRGMLPGMLLRVCRECVHFVNQGLGANMMGGISYTCERGKLWRHVVCQLSLFKRHPLFGHPLFGHLCSGTLCLGGGGQMAPIADLLEGGSIHAWGE